MKVVLQQPALTKYRVPVFRELASRPNIDLTVLYGETPGIPNVHAEGFKAEFVPIRRLGVPGRPVWHSAQLRACRDADVAILTWDVHYTSLLPALIRARANRVRTVLWGHGYSKREATWRRGVRRWMGARANGILLYSQSAATQLVEAGFDRSRVFVAPNSLDLEPAERAAAAWRDEPGRLACFREKHRLNDGPVLLFVSRLGPERRVDLLLRAGATLRSSHPGLRIVLVGAGPELERLRALSEELGLTDRVEFVGALYEEEELAPYFLSATVFCFPNSVGLSVLHAMGYGLPVVTTDDAARQGPEIDAVEAGVNGLLYAAGNADDLARKIESIIGDAETRARLSTGALQTVTERYNVRVMIDGMQEAIEQVSRS